MSNRVLFSRRESTVDVEQSSSMGGRSGSLNQKGLPPQLFKPMSDSCHSFLSCDPGQRNGPMREGVKGHPRWRLVVGAWFGMGDR